MFLQTEPHWYNDICQYSTRFNDNKEIQRLSQKDILEKIGSPANFRGYVFQARMYMWMLTMSSLFRLNLKDENPFVPALEVFLANKYALENNKKIYYV